MHTIVVKNYSISQLRMSKKTIFLWRWCGGSVCRYFLAVVTSSECSVSSWCSVSQRLPLRSLCGQWAPTGSLSSEQKPDFYPLILPTASMAGSITFKHLESLREFLRCSVRKGLKAPLRHQLLVLCTHVCCCACVCWEGRGEQKMMSAVPVSSWKGLYGKVHLLHNLTVIVGDGRGSWWAPGCILAIPIVGLSRLKLLSKLREKLRS